MMAKLFLLSAVVFITALFATPIQAVDSLGMPTYRCDSKCQYVNKCVEGKKLTTELVNYCVALYNKTQIYRVQGTWNKRIISRVVLKK
jgi:hypothetical protein